MSYLLFLKVDGNRVTQIGEASMLPDGSRWGDIKDLLARNAEDVKSGAGQCFTPRPMIEDMVQVVDPESHQSVHDPACGTAGFLLAAWEHMKRHPKARDRAVYSALRGKFSGVHIVPETFSASARDTAELLSKRIVLIDGSQFARLMLSHGVGCRAEETLTIKRIDEDFFDP